MLHIIKQIKGGFIGFIESNLLDKQTATDLADSFDTDKDKTNISRKELEKKYDELVRNNDSLTYEIKNLVRDIYMKKVKGIGSEKINKQEFIKLLTNQEAEHKNILTIHQGAKRQVRKETNDVVSRHEKLLNGNTEELKTQNKEELKTQNKEDTETINKNNTLINLLEKVNENNTSKNVKNLQRFLGVTADGQLGPKTKKAINNFKGVKTNKSVETNTSVSEINATKNIADKYIKQLKFLDKVLGDYENEVGDNGTISKHIGIVGIIREMSTNEQNRYLRSIVDTSNPECNKLLAGLAKHPAMVGTILQLLVSFALSGGTSVSIPLFGIKIGSHMINKGPISKMLKKAGVNKPTILAKVMRQKGVSKNQIETISDLLSGKHFQGGGLESTIDAMLYKGKLGKSFFKFFGMGKSLYSKLERFKNINSNSIERVKLVKDIEKELKPYLKKIEYRLKLAYEIKKLYGTNNSMILSTDSKFDKYKKEQLHIGNLDSTIGKLKKAQEDGTTLLNNILNQVVDINNKTKTKSEINKEIQKGAIQKDKELGLSPQGKLTGIKSGRYAPKLGKGGWDKWLSRVERYSSSHNRKATALSTILSAGKVYGELGEGKVSLKNIENAFKNGRYLLSEERAEELKKMKNTSTSGDWNTKFNEYAIYEVEIGGHKMYLKDNCSNVLDKTPDVNGYVEAGDYFTVSMSRTVNKKTTETTKTTENETIVKQEVDTASTTTDVQGGINNANSPTSAIDNTQLTESTSTGGSFIVGDTVDPSPVDISTTLPSVGVGIDVPVYEYITVTTYNTEIIKEITKSIGIDYTVFDALVGLIGNGISAENLCIKAKEKGININTKQAEIAIKGAKKVGKPTSDFIKLNKETLKNKSEKYIVISGDTLSEIASKYKGISYKDIAKANNIKKPYKIKVGKELIIPIK